MFGPLLFVALVRAIGVYWLSQGLTYLAAAFAPVQGYTPALYVLLGVSEMILGVFLMFKANGIVETCYSLSELRNADADHDAASQRSYATPHSGPVSEDPNNPQILSLVPSEAEASLIVNHLADNGIKASILGTSLGAIWPQIPREVQVVVRQADLSRARELLDSFKTPDED